MWQQSQLDMAHGMLPQVETHTWGIWLILGIDLGPGDIATYSYVLSRAMLNVQYIHIQYMFDCKSGHIINLHPKSECFFARNNPSWVEIYFALKIGMCSEEVTLKYNGSWLGILIWDGVRHSMLGMKDFNKSWIGQKTYSDVILCQDWLWTRQGNLCSGWKTLINLRLDKRHISIIYNAKMYYNSEQIIAMRIEQWSVLTQYTSDEHVHNRNRNANPSFTGRRIIS